MTLTNITGGTLKFEGLTLHIPVNKLVRICKRGGRGLRAQGRQSPERSWNTTFFFFFFAKPVFCKRPHLLYLPLYFCLLYLHGTLNRLREQTVFIPAAKLFSFFSAIVTCL